MIEYDSLNEYLDKNKPKPGVQLKITVDGEIGESALSKTKCVYFEASTLLYKNGQLVGNTTSFGSDNDIFMIIEKKAKVRVSVNKMRTYLKPVYKKEFTIDEITDEERKTRFAKSGYEKIADIEFILQKDKKYYAMFGEESYHLPPDRRGGQPRRATNTVIWISDKEYKDGKPQVEITPHYKGWKY